ncbi:MAG: S-adenosylmethionine:tRNA ribosyltransferase-isomerase, partial [Planctomycetota bacterium]
MPDPSADPLLFDYELPRELIAQEPLPNRVDARLLVVDRTSRSLAHHHVRDLPDLLRRGDRLVLNDTKVLPAKLLGVRTNTGGAWQGLVLGAEPNGDMRLVCKTRGTIRPPEKVTLHDRDNRDAGTLWLIERIDGGQWFARPDGDETVDALVQRVGRVPLPHYIRGGKMVDDDLARYQTVFARKPGAVAAPTAGLHFTEPLMRHAADRGVEFTALTLHVGLGTFRPVTAEKAEDHVMHAEWCELSPKAATAINTTRAAGGRVVAIGT